MVKIEIGNSQQKEQEHQGNLSSSLEEPALRFILHTIIMFRKNVAYYATTLTTETI